MRLTEDDNSTLFAVFGWAYSGVDFDLPGNGGQDCVDFLHPKQRLVESGLASLFAMFIMYKAYPRITLPATQRPPRTEQETFGKRLLLVLMCLTWGCELGFKFATRQMIWIFNPCHISTAVQICLLASAPSKAVTAAFRLHMHLLAGAPIAILFPVINTRLLPFETEVYYIQHVLILVIPFYLLYFGDPYIPEQLGDFSWAAMTFGIAFLYHFIPLQILAIATRVNLNNMLCPAVSDPFHGPFYRMVAIGHQTILIPSLGKIYAAVARYLGWCLYEKEAPVADLIKEELSAIDGAAATLLGKAGISGKADPPAAATADQDSNSAVAAACSRVSAQDMSSRNGLKNRKAASSTPMGASNGKCVLLPGNGHLKDQQ